MITVVDTETSDMIKRNLPLDHDGQPWIVTLSAKLIDATGKPLDFFSTRIRADGRKIRSGAEAVHGITSAAAEREGMGEIIALGALLALACQSRYIVGYGLDFDKDVVTSVLMRRGKDVKFWTRPGLRFIDLMKPAAHFCKIPSTHEAGGYKWPSLDEACERILGEPPREGHHGSWEDMERALRLFMFLRDAGALDLT